MEQLEKINEITKLQKEIMNLTLDNNMILDIEENENENEINDESEDDFPELKGKIKKRKYRSKSINKIKDINKVRDKNKVDNIYEIENIIEHKIIDKSYKFLVKWKGFNSNDNSWISLSSFNEKELLVDYLSKKNILIPGINL